MPKDNAQIDAESFVRLPHAITLLGMSGVGKTMLSTALRRKDGWFHYSADYRIGTAYLAEHILDNLKFKIMRMEDPFVANLLRSDSIYINHNITVDNLEPVSTFLGMYGDSMQGGLDKKTFLERQELYRHGEQESMKDVPRFIAKAWRIYRCWSFVNDASGSLCEIVDLADSADPVIAALRSQSLVLYLRAGEHHEEALKARAEEDPKPLFYHPEFIGPRLAEQPDTGLGVDPKEFARSLFPELVQFRKPRYQEFADRWGFTLDVADLFAGREGSDPTPSPAAFLRRLHEVATQAAETSEVARDNLNLYLDVCRRRADDRGLPV
jgi:hypothetical protein